MGLMKRSETQKDVALREHRSENGTVVIKETLPGVADVVAVTKAVESGLEAAVSRLQTAKPAETNQKAYKPYEDPSARGKTRCAQFEAAMTSPGLAGLKFNTLEEFLAICHRAADYGTAYTFNELDPK